jgi:hypothetical protein
MFPRPIASYLRESNISDFSKTCKYLFGFAFATFSAIIAGRPGGGMVDTTDLKSVAG